MSLVVDLDPLLASGPIRMTQPILSDAEFAALCQRNRDLRIEQAATGEVIFMSPTGSETGQRCAEIVRQLANANIAANEPGVAFDSSTGFLLPSGAKRSPDASWVAKARWDALTDAERKTFAPICPDFVIELLSPTDRLADTQAKMDEYLANGATLGWLISPEDRQVHVYRPGEPVEILPDPASVSGDPVLPGFTLDLRRIFRSH